jgi:hypothetical protein
MTLVASWGGVNNACIEVEIFIGNFRSAQAT